MAFVDYAAFQGAGHYVYNTGKKVGPTNFSPFGDVIVIQSLLYYYRTERKDFALSIPLERPTGDPNKSFYDLIRLYQEHANKISGKNILKVDGVVSPIKGHKAEWTYGKRYTLFQLNFDCEVAHWVNTGGAEDLHLLDIQAKVPEINLGLWGMT